MPVYRHRNALMCDACAHNVMDRLPTSRLVEFHVVEHVSPEKVCGGCLKPLHPEGEFGAQDVVADLLADVQRAADAAGMEVDKPGSPEERGLVKAKLYGARVPVPEGHEHSVRVFTAQAVDPETLLPLPYRQELPGRLAGIADAWAAGELEVWRAHDSRGRRRVPSPFTHFVHGFIAGTTRAYLVQATSDMLTPIDLDAHDHLTRAALGKLRLEGREVNADTLDEARTELAADAMRRHIEELRADRWTAQFAGVLGYGWGGSLAL